MVVHNKRSSFPCYIVSFNSVVLPIVFAFNALPRLPSPLADKKITSQKHCDEPRSRACDVYLR